MSRAVPPTETATDRDPGSDRITVLVPDAAGLEALAGMPRVHPLRYVPGEPWPDGHAHAAVLVVGFDKAADIAAGLHGLTGLRLIQTLNAGFEQWLPLLPAGVLLSNGRGAHGGSTAEWVVAALLSLVRDLPRFAAQQAEGRWESRHTGTLIGTKVVVLGAGDLARNLAARLAPFEVEVILVGRHARPGVRAFADLENADLDDADGDPLSEADAVVAMLPDDPSTRHLVDAALLSRLPDGAIVVNAGRGGAVDTDALLAELCAGRLRAALDVTDPEPLPPAHPLWSAPGLVLTPHVAGSTAGAHRRAWAVAREQIAVFADGGRPPNVVAGPGVSA